MKEKKCFKCGKVKSIDEFYKHSQMADGYSNKCKDCKKEDSRLNHREKSKDPSWIAGQRERNRQKYYRLGYKEKHKPDFEQKKTTMQRYFGNNPEKRKATVRVGNAIRDGRLERQPCEVCGTAINVQAHHDDYSKPLEVRWLCIKHHNEYHREVREKELFETLN